MGKKSILEFIDILIANLGHDYKHLKLRTEQALSGDTLSESDKIHLEWGLVHLRNSLDEFERDLLRHRKVLEKDDK